MEQVIEALKKSIELTPKDLEAEDKERYKLLGMYEAIEWMENYIKEKQDVR